MITNKLIYSVIKIKKQRQENNMPTVYFPNENKGAEGPIIKWIPTGSGVSIGYDHEKWEQTRKQRMEDGEANNDYFFRPIHEGRCPLKESSFKVMKNPKCFMMKANQVNVTSSKATEAYPKYKPNPKELRDYTDSWGYKQWRDYENDKAAKRAIERKHCERKMEERCKHPWYGSFEMLSYYGTHPLELSQGDFGSKNGPNRKCKQKSYHKRMPKEVAGKRRGNNRWRGDSASRSIRRKLKKKQNINKSWRKAACGDRGWDPVKGKGRRVKCMVSDNI